MTTLYWKLKKLIIGLLFVFSVFIFSNCWHTNISGEINDEIVLKIGNLEITKYEFLKNRDKAYDIKAASSDFRNNWLKNYIDDAYLIADAYETKMDTLPQIIQLVNYAAKSMLAQDGGYVWNKVEEPKLVFKDEDLKNAYKMRDKVFYIEYLRFENSDTLFKYNKGKMISNEIDFKLTVLNTKKNNKIFHISGSYQWPFNELGALKNIIQNMTPNSVTKPLQLGDNKVIIYLINTEKINQASYKLDKDNINWVLIQTKKQEIIDNKKKEINDKSKIKINNIQADLLVKALNESDSNSFKLNRNEVLMNYNLNNESISFSIGDFLDYCNYNPFSTVVSDRISLDNQLFNIVDENYMFIEAKKLRIFDDKQFKLDQKNYLNRVLNVLYQKKEFKTPKIDEKLVKEYYSKNKASYISAKTCIISFLTFKNKECAEHELGYINTLVYTSDYTKFSDTIALKGLLSYEPNIKINKINKKYTKDFIDYVFNIQANVAAYAFERNSNIIFFKTKEEGKEIQTLEEARPTIIMTIEKNISTQLKIKKIKELKKKFECSINKTISLL